MTNVWFKYKIGDQVRIIPDFDKHRYDDDPNIDFDMLKYADKVVKIKSYYNVKDRPMYELIESHWIWDERWLEPVDKDINLSEDEFMNMLGV